MTGIKNKDDIIDSRDVIDRIDILSDIDSPTVCEAKELAALKALASEISGQRVCSPCCDPSVREIARFRPYYHSSGCVYEIDWGTALIRDGYFKEYAMELAADLAVIKDDAQWPNYCIDWDQAARELQYDYTAVDFDGVPYWIRST